MLHVEFTNEERKALHFERFHHPHPRVQQKMEAVLLKSHDLPHAKIAYILQITEADASYFVFTGEADNTMYKTADEKINILFTHAITAVFCLCHHYPHRLKFMISRIFQVQKMDSDMWIMM